MRPKITETVSAIKERSYDEVVRQRSRARVRESEASERGDTGITDIPGAKA